MKTTETACVSNELCLDGYDGKVGIRGYEGGIGRDRDIGGRYVDTI